MKRPPRAPDESLFSLAMVAWSVFQGAIAFALLATVFLVEAPNGMPEAELRALMFFALVAEIVALILVNRSFSASLVDAFTRHNAVLGYVIVAIATITGVILFWPRAQDVLKFGSITWHDMALAAGLGVALLIALEGCKPCVRRAFSRSSVAISHPKPA